MSDSERSTRYMPDDWSIPLLTDENRAFFTSQSISIQRCYSCENVQHPPEEVCRKCGSMTFAYDVASPVGVVESYTIVHHAMHPSLKSCVPYNVAIISLESHPDIRIVGNVIDATPEEMQIGLEVEATWAQVPPPAGQDEALYLPQWRIVA